MPLYARACLHNSIQPKSFYVLVLLYILIVTVLQQDAVQDRYSAGFSPDYVFEGIVTRPGQVSSTIQWLHDGRESVERNAAVGIEQIIPVNHTVSTLCH